MTNQTGSTSSPDADAQDLESTGTAQGVRAATKADLDAVRQIVEDATKGYARSIEYANGWRPGTGVPDRITTTPSRVVVTYGGALPPSVSGPLKENIVEALVIGGFDYRGWSFPGTVVIVPDEGYDY